MEEVYKRDYKDKPCYRFIASMVMIGAGFFVGHYIARFHGFEILFGEFMFIVGRLEAAPKL